MSQGIPTVEERLAGLSAQERVEILDLVSEIRLAYLAKGTRIPREAMMALHAKNPKALDVLLSYLIHGMPEPKEESTLSPQVP